MKKMILVALMLGMTLTAYSTKRYRIKIIRIEGKLRYIPQAKRKSAEYLVKRWIDISNQPLTSENEARNYINSAQIIVKEMQDVVNIKYIYINYNK